MGMPITVEVVGGDATLLESVFAYFKEVDERFSTYKENSEISKINRGELQEGEYSPHMREVFALAEKTKQETNGFFDIKTPVGLLDPSGIVKGWAIQNAAELLKEREVQNFCIEAGGDIQTSGKNEEGGEWSVGIRNPFNPSEIIKVLYPKGRGVATSGSYARGAHIYNPHNKEASPSYWASITVLGPNVLEADRFATAAFAMGQEGAAFIEQLPGFEAYAIDQNGIATITGGFGVYTCV